MAEVAEVMAFVGCAGFGLVDVVLREFGFDVVAVEIDDAIAEVNRRNGGHCLTADLLDVDPADYADWTLYHFSPPCPSFSVAKQGRETETDLALARKICEFIRVGRPTLFTLENVWGYRKSLSWHLIQYTLLQEGYGLDAWHLNSADYGVPQSRRRMIAIARRDGRQPAKPFPTHSKAGDMFTQPWRGWFGAIEDLIPTLKETQFAPWQMDRLPEELKTLLMIPGDNASNQTVRRGHEPMVTIQTRTPERCPHRAFLLGQGERSKPKTSDHPADTVTANGNQTGAKAFVINSQNTTRALTVRTQDQPMTTITASEGRRPDSFPKAFIVDCQSNGRMEQRGLTIRKTHQPVFTMTASANRRPIRAALSSGKVVVMTPLALARFQDFPDWFVLPDKRELACRGIGNALPPGLYRAVLKSLGFKKGEIN